jgi:hypothetical protein
LKGIRRKVLDETWQAFGFKTEEMAAKLIETIFANCYSTCYVFALWCVMTLKGATLPSPLLSSSEEKNGGLGFGTNNTDLIGFFYILLFAMHELPLFNPAP